MIKLIYGDCLEILPTLEKNSFDMTFNDLPYGTTACSWDSIIPFDKMWDALNPVMKERAAKIFTGTEPFSSHLRLSNLKEFKYDWVWHKNLTGGFALSKIQPFISQENCSVFYFKQSTYNFIKELRDTKPQSKERIKYKYKDKGNLNNIYKNFKSYKKEGYICDELRYPTTIKKFDCVNPVKRIHPTQKPVTLISYMIKTYTNEGETIIDITCGSCSTGIAAQETNRNAILIEKSPLWYNVAVRRNQGEDHKSLKAYIKEMRERYGPKKADFEAPLQFPKEMVIKI